MKTNAAHLSPAAPSSRLASGAIRILTAVPLCDGHDSAIVTINLELVRHGVEVIYLGYHRSAADIARAAIQEDARAIGLSSYNGGHVEFFAEVLASLRRQDARDIRLFGGGGGTITPADARQMKRRGVDEIFFAGTPLAEIARFVKTNYAQPPKVIPKSRAPAKLSDRVLAKALTTAGNRSVFPTPMARGSTLTVGIAGPGGVGKTTLIDELALRFLKSHPDSRLAILSHDPSPPGKGALLADRAAMVYAHHQRVFLRSLPTRGKAGGVSRATPGCLEILKRAGFSLILVESAGIGQEDLPFAHGLVDRQVLVMGPDYGSRLQLQKILMLESADFVVVNKSDQAGARTALSEIEQRLALNNREQKLIATVAKRHLDPGVDALFNHLNSMKYPGQDR